MKFCAIICEFNPLHNGHKYLIEKAKQITGLPVICLMSGNFCQRAETCCLNKYTRAKHAIECGADIVFELPTIFATGSANTFARGAVNILKELPVSHLAFGSECGDIEKLIKAKEFCKSLENNPKVKEELENGVNYKTALQNIAKENSDVFDIISKPNNTLAIEYLKAIEQTGIVPITIKREDNYLCGKKEFCSSTTIRQAILDHESAEIESFVPSYVFCDFDKFKDDSNIKEHLFFALKTATKGKLANLFSVSEGLENRIAKCAEKANNYDEFVEMCVTKRYSRIRIRRIILENFFGITKTIAKDCLCTAVPTTILLAKSPTINFDGFFDKQINLVLKKSDRKKFANEFCLQIDLWAEKLYER